jgi:hypothetical protein
MRGRRSLLPLWCIIVALPLALPAQRTEPKSLHGKIDLTIGGPDESRDVYLFEDVRGLTFDAQGRIFVAENKANEVRVFSPDGKLLYKMGQKGEGPGDLKDPCCIALSPKGQLWIKEFGNHRYSIFDIGATKGTFRWAVTLPRAMSWGGDDRITWDRAGRLIDLNGRPFVQGKPTGLYRSLLDSSGRVVRRDSFDVAPGDSVPMWVHIQTQPGGGTASSGGNQPFGPYKLRAFGPEGDAAQAISSRYAISWDNIGGKRLALLQRDVKGPALTGKERQSAEEIIASIEKRWGEKLPFGVPDRKPPLAGIGFDLDGRLWVELTMPEGSPHRADVYDRSHRLIGSMEWPANVRLDLWAVRGNTGIGMARDADGTQSVVRLRFGP